MLKLTTKNSNELVRHVTSPSHREQLRQVITSKVQFDRRRLKHQRTVQPLRHPIRPPQLSLAYTAFPAAGSTVSHLSFFFKATKRECFA
jgi:hypothetical protein